jgi:hypothetical protein
MDVYTVYTAKYLTLSVPPRVVLAIAPGEICILKCGRENWFHINLNKTKSFIFG